MKLRPLTRFQLTPLMDLLLIIVFAQFLEIRQTSREQTETLAAERQRLADTTARERSQLAAIESQIRKDLATLQSQRDQARASRDRANTEREAAIRTTAEAMKTLAGWLNIEGADIESFGIGGEDAADPSRQAAIDRAKSLSQSDPTTVLKFLISHAELLKRAEVWTVHANDRGEIELTADDQVESFRLENSNQEARTSEATDRLFAAYKQLDEPKGLVIILVTFDPRSVAGVYQPLIDAVPLAAERFRADKPTSRFEYTVLGTQPTQSAQPKSP